VAEDKTGWRNEANARRQLAATSAASLPSPGRGVGRGLGVYCVPIVTRRGVPPRLVLILPCGIDGRRSVRELTGASKLRAGLYS
jgi:hypothetical protein